MRYFGLLYRFTFSVMPCSHKLSLKVRRYLADLQLSYIPAAQHFKLEKIFI